MFWLAMPAVKTTVMDLASQKLQFADRANLGGFSSLEESARPCLGQLICLQGPLKVWQCWQCCVCLM